VDANEAARENRDVVGETRDAPGLCSGTQATSSVGIVSSALALEEALVLGSRGADGAALPRLSEGGRARRGPVGRAWGRMG